MFFALDAFPFARRLEQEWQTIWQECRELPGTEFTAWPETNLYNQGWDVYGLFAGRRALLENCIFCPQTTNLLRTIPGLENAGFSRLRAGCEIAPHVGYTNQVLRLHLGLQVPPACALRVGSETAHWEEGKCLVFDDTVEHAAWNRSQGERIILLVDFARDQAVSGSLQ